MLPGTTLFVFIDESGNFDFSPQGTKYWLLTALATEAPMQGREALIALRYELLSAGHDEEYFHATEDAQGVRDRVYGVLGDLLDVTVHSVYVQKNKTNPFLYERRTAGGKKKARADNLYNQVAQSLLKYVFMKYGKRSHLNQVVV